MASCTAKTVWKRREPATAVGNEIPKRATKAPSEDDRSGGDSSPGRSLQKPRPRKSSTNAAPQKTKARRAAVRSIPSSVVGKKPRVEKKQRLSATECEHLALDPSRSKSSTRDRSRHSQQRKNHALPPYIRATIAEQLAPARSRPAREDTQETLFGNEQKPRKVLSNARYLENTQKTLFGEPDPLAAGRKSSRHVTDTKNTLFGPPPQVPARSKPQQRPDTPDLLSHAIRPQTEVRETQLTAIVSRYILRHQDTHNKLFGAPEALRKPPPLKPTSCIFFQDDTTNEQVHAVKSLPLGSVIVITRDVQSPGPQEVVGQN